MNKLLLHIGTPKTGTSALQHFLYNNSLLQGKETWVYPALKEKMNQYYDYSRNVEKNGSLFYEGIKLYSQDSPVWKDVCHIIEKEINNNNVILSAEEMYEYNTKEIITFLKKMFDNIKVVIYLRRQDLYIESRYNQIVKDNRCYTGTFEQYVKDSENWGEGHYLEKLDMISDIAGIDNVIVRVYEKEQLVEGDVVTDFLQLLAITGIHSEGMKSNESLVGGFFELKRVLNNIYDVERYGSCLEYVDVLLSAQKNYCKNQKRSNYYFLPNERKQYLESFNDENEIIAKKYMHKEERQLFLDLNCDIQNELYNINDEMIFATKSLFHYLFEKSNNV